MIIMAVPHLAPYYASLGTISAGSITSAMIEDLEIVNADVNASAAIAYSKLNLTGSIVTADIATAGIAPKITTIKNADAGTMNVEGLISTRSHADDSMYVPVANASSGTERGMKICYAPAANGCGYFESQYVNTKVAASMAGTLRASEHKVSVTGSANASGEVAAIYAKVNAETGATIANAIGVDVELDPEGSATITSATGVRINNTGSTKMAYGIDVSSPTFSHGAIKCIASSGSGKTRAVLAAGTGTTYNSSGSAFVGLHTDTSDSNKLYAVFKNGSDFYWALLTAQGS